MKLNLLCLFYFLVLIVLTPSALWGESASSKKAVSELRNQIILKYNPEISIRADGVLCFLHEGTYLVTQVVFPCEDIFIKIVESLSLPSLLKLEKDRGTLFVNGLSRYVVLLMVAIEEGALDEYEPYLKQISAIAVFLDQVVMEAPEYFSEDQLFNSLFSSYEVLLKIFFGKTPDVPTIHLSQVMVQRNDLLTARGYQGKVLKELLTLFYNDPSLYMMEKLSYAKESFVPYLLSRVEETGSQKRVKTSPSIPVENESLNKFKQLLFMSALGFLCVVSYFVYVSFRKRSRIEPSHANREQPYLNSEERAELRDLRQFFHLRPTEGIETLNKQYRVLVRKLHPDVIHDSGESFISFQERYHRTKVLLDRLQEEKMKRFANER
jgi:hypothetical protein